MTRRSRSRIAAIETGLPFAGPIAAFVTMMLLGMGTAAMHMIGG